MKDENSGLVMVLYYVYGYSSDRKITQGHNIFVMHWSSYSIVYIFDILYKNIMSSSLIVLATSAQTVYLTMQ